MSSIYNLDSKIVLASYKSLTCRLLPSKFYAKWSMGLSHPPWCLPRSSAPSRNSNYKISIETVINFDDRIGRKIGRHSTLQPPSRSSSLLLIRVTKNSIRERRNERKIILIHDISKLYSAGISFLNNFLLFTYIYIM